MKSNRNAVSSLKKFAGGALLFALLPLASAQSAVDVDYIRVSGIGKDGYMLTGDIVKAFYALLVLLTAGVWLLVALGVVREFRSWWGSSS